MKTSTAETHLSEETLHRLATHAGSLNAEEQLHLQGCTHCQSEVALSQVLRRLALSERVPLMPQASVNGGEGMVSALSPETLELLAEQVKTPPVPPMPLSSRAPTVPVASQRPPLLSMASTLTRLRVPALVLSLLLVVWMLRPLGLMSPRTEPMPERIPELTPEPVPMLNTRGTEAQALELSITGQIYRNSPAGLEKVLELSSVQREGVCQPGDRLLLQLTGQGQGALEVWRVGANSMRRQTRLPGVGLSPSERALSGTRLLLAGEASPPESWPLLSGAGERWVVFFGTIPTGLVPKDVLRLLASGGEPSLRMEVLRCEAGR